MNLPRIPVALLFTSAIATACGSARPALPPPGEAAAPDPATDAKLQQA
jgi:hypothetical protein